MMSSGERGVTGAEARPDHLQRTADNSRHDIITSATVESISQLSETVKGLMLTVGDKDFTFKAGQWVDFHIPDVATVGGFSMFTSPNQLQDEHKLGLAVKYSKHPPAHWVHTKCCTGSKVNLRVGGDFYYDGQDNSNLLLIAGGVGINPLYSILLYASELISKDVREDKKIGPQQVKLLYSSGSVKEMFFKDQISTVCQMNDRISSEFYVTREKTTSPDLINGRIDKAHLKSAMSSFPVPASDVKCYLCGPSSMIEDMETMLLDQGLAKSHIFYEKWW